MTLVILIPLLVAVVGMLIYALSANGKVAELGRIAYFCGLLVALLTLARQTLRIG